MPIMEEYTLWLATADASAIPFEQLIVAHHRQLALVNPSKRMYTEMLYASSDILCIIQLGNQL